MWIIFVCSQKKFSVEVTGEETFHDIETILSEVYGFNPHISFLLNSTAISDKSYFTPIQEFPKIQDFTHIVIKEKGKSNHIIPPNVSQEKAIAIGNNDNNQLTYKSKSSSKRSRNSEKLGSILDENPKKDHKKSKKKSTDDSSAKDSKEDKNATEKKHKHHKHSDKDGTSKHHKHRDTDGNHKHHKHKHSDTDGKRKQSDQNGHHKHHKHTKE